MKALNVVGLSAVGFTLLFGVSTVYAQANNHDVKLLDEKEYRSDMEEVVVQGQVPEWRKAELEQELWRRDRFELAEEQKPSRIEWLPAYTKEDRENYQSVRDRTGEKPEFKLFEWKF